MMTVEKYGLRIIMNRSELYVALIDDHFILYASLALKIIWHGIVSFTTSIFIQHFESFGGFNL